MKTVDQIKAEIKTTIFNGKKEIQKRFIRRAQAQIKFLNDALAYAESNPNEQFIKKCELKVNKKLTEIRAAAKKLPREMQSAYKTENDFKKLSLQSKMLDYILS